MPRKSREKSKTGVYHIILRGANRQEIFHDDEDFRIFLGYLRRYKKECGLEVYAWCLMNNHVHLVLKEGNEGISDVMKRIGVSFAQYYNGKYKASGHLFQDRFKSECVENSRYLMAVIRYVHQNPLKARMVKRVEEWIWSSCCGYYGEKFNYRDLLDCKHILGLISRDPALAVKKFKEYNELENDSKCMDDEQKIRFTDEEAREEIKEVLGGIEIARVKSLPKEERNEVLRRVKARQGLTIRQVARIFGVSVGLVFRA